MIHNSIFASFSEVMTGIYVMCVLWKNIFWFSVTCDHLLYIPHVNVLWWSSFIYTSCVTCEKKFFLLFSDQYECVRCFIRMCIIIFYKYSPPVMMIIFYIYNVWSQMCDLWKKYFLFLGDMCDHEWSSFIYIQWDLMCSGSPTITDVWLVKKKFYFSVTNTNVWPVIIFYIYTMRPNV